MEGGAVGNNFEMGLPKDYPSQIWFNLVQQFQRRRFKCESLRCTTDDGKSSHGLWLGKLKSVNCPGAMRLMTLIKLVKMFVLLSPTH
jgi:hypothetical protein